MTALKLPVEQTSALFSFQVELEGVTFGLTFRWNDRESAWRMDLADGDGVMLVSGIAVRLDVPMLRRFAVEAVAGLPAGEIMAYDSAGTGEEAGFEDLGRRVIIFYVPAADVAAATAR